MKKKKILHIVESFGSGVFSFLVDLVNGYSEKYDVYIAFGERGETPNNYKEYFNNVKFLKVNNFTRNINLVKDIKAFIEIKKIIKEVNPDVIHLHSSKAGFIGRFASNNKKYKVFYNPHGFAFLMQSSSILKRKIYYLLEKIATIKNVTIIGCSQGEYEEAKKLTNNAICINNGINTLKIDNLVNSKVTKRLDFNKLVFCTSGRIGYQKNPKMFNEVALKYPNNKFIWIGDGELKSELTAPNIEITGWKERKEVLNILNEADIFLLLSFCEGLPISLLEAMYLKKLCLVTDCIGNRDVIRSGENGYLVDLNNINNIINSLTEERYLRITDFAKKSIINTYNTQLMVTKYIECYNEEG